MTLLAGPDPAQPHETTLAYVVPIVKRKMRSDSSPFIKSLARPRLAIAT